jgi:NAD(P)H-nitrite reductase large subunit
MEDNLHYDSEKLLKLDVKRREYDIIVIGEEPHLAYNRVGLTSFFQHREVENLYLNPKEWVRQPQMTGLQKTWLMVP